MNIRPAAALDIPAMLDLERRSPAAAHWSRQQYEDLFRGPEDGSRRLVLVVDETDDGSGITSEFRFESQPQTASSRVLGFLVANQIVANQIGANQIGANQVGNEWELDNVVVAPDFRRKGLATRLLTALLTRARETNSERVFLEVRESNQAARALYVRLGFEESGRRKFYYVDPQEDAVLYRLALNSLSTTWPSA